MKKTVRIAAVGLGSRGDLVRIILLPMQKEGHGVEVVGICDVHQDRVDKMTKAFEEAGLPVPYATNDYNDLLKLDCDAILIFSSWSTHIPFACAAMRAGKYVGMEVAGAYSLEDCWKLVHTSEETGIPCMLLENCCYDRRELMLLNMVKQGVFGSLSHCSGAYRHDLRHELAYSPEDHNHYRLYEYIHRNGENYPTHELGPIAKLLDINRGNRMVSLNSVASCAKGMHEYILEHKGADDPLANTVFQQGDVVTTVIRCANGETITLTLDTTLPRYYSRQFSIHGTKGMYTEDNDSIFLDGKDDAAEFTWKEHWGNAKEYEAQYLHPIWKNFTREDQHGGMDWHTLDAFIECVRLEGPAPIDVYDAASWMCITALSEASIQAGGAAVAIPDFTSGRWINREPVLDYKYRLDRVVE